MTNEELINRFSDNPYDDSLEAEILSRLNRIEEAEKENKELKEGLFEKFSECYEVNKWTPESGFDSQLDFYIHESWKREPVVDKLRKQVEDLQKRLDVACHIKADDKVSFDFAILDIVDKYERLEEIICASAPLTWARGEYINEVANFEKSLTDILHEQSDNLTREEREK